LAVTTENAHDYRNLLELFRPSGVTFDASMSASRSLTSNRNERPILTNGTSRLQTIEYKLPGVVPKNFAASRTFNNRTCSQLLSSCSPAIAPPHGAFRPARFQTTKKTSCAQDFFAAKRVSVYPVADTEHFVAGFSNAVTPDTWQPIPVPSIEAQITSANPGLPGR
jgi:hypothetical protein